MVMNNIYKKYHHNMEMMNYNLVYLDHLLIFVMLYNVVFLDPFICLVILLRICGGFWSKFDSMAVRRIVKCLS